MAELKRISFNGKQLNSLTRADVDALISSELASFDKLDYKVADSVPTATEVVIGGQTVPAQTGVRYLVKNSETGNYEEYILVDGVVHDIGSTSDGQVEMILPVNPDPEPVEVGHIWIKTEPDYNAMTWADSTDEELAFMLQSHDEGKIDLYSMPGWALGSTRSVNLSAMEANAPLTDTHVAQTVELMLVDRDVQSLWPTETLSKSHFVWQQKDCLLTTGMMNSTATNVGGWHESARKKWCDETYYNALPESFRSLLLEANIESSPGGAVTTTELGPGKIFLPSASNVLGANSYSVETDAQWEYYKTTANRIKRRSGSTVYWWLRSPYRSNSNYFCTINSSGSMYYYGSANSVYSLAPCGCI